MRKLSIVLSLLLASACTTPRVQRAGFEAATSGTSLPDAELAQTPASAENLQQVASAPAPPGGVSGESDRGQVDPACKALEVAPPEEVCAALPEGYGVQAELPLEWALLGTRRGLPHHLVCASGAEIELGSTKGSRAIAVPSTAPRGGFAAVFGGSNRDTLDSWEVTCPGTSPLIVVSNPYRCGNPCPPRALRRVPAGALEAIAAGSALVEEKRWAEARERFEAALTFAPNLERARSWVGTISLVLKDAPTAIAAFEACLALQPDNPYYALHLAMAQKLAGEEAPLHATVEDLLKRLPESHSLRPELLCRKARRLAELKSPEAQALAQQACEAGRKQCCDFKP